MQVYKVGVVLDNLGPNQMAYTAMREINDISQKCNSVDFTLFFDNIMLPCMIPFCSTMCINELWHFNGMIITTNINNTIKASKIPSNKKIVFYVWDLEWLRPNKQDYLYNIQAYRGNNISLIARSKSHLEAIQNYANRSVDALIPDFDLSTMIGMFYD